MNELTATMTEEENPLFEQRLNNALDGLEYYYCDHLKNRISKLNAFTIANYVLAMKVETNLSPNHKRGRPNKRSRGISSGIASEK